MKSEKRIVCKTKKWRRLAFVHYMNLSFYTARSIRSVLSADPYWSATNTPCYPGTPAVVSATGGPVTSDDRPVMGPAAPHTSSNIVPAALPRILFVTARRPAG